MVDVPVDDALQELLLAAAGPVRRHAAVRQLGPDQHPHPVGDLVIARVRRLDVAAQAVEAEFLRLAELVLQEFHRRHGADRVRVVVLVEGGAQVERLAVEVELAAAGLDRAESEPVLDRVPLLPVPGHDEADRIEVRLVRRPGFHVADRELERHRGDADLGVVRLVEDDSPRGIADLDAHRRLAGERAGEEHARGDPARVPARHEPDPGHMVGNPPLEIDRLPDAGERAVPALLAERDLREGRIRELGRVVGRRVDPHLDLVGSRAQMAGDVEREGQEAALVRADLLAVDEDPRVVEHRPEPDPDAVRQPGLVDLDRAPVDADPRPHAQIRELRLPGARHRDLTDLDRTREAVVGHVQKLPGPVQADAGIAHALSSESAVTQERAKRRNRGPRRAGRRAARRTVSLTLRHFGKHPQGPSARPHPRVAFSPVRTTKQAGLGSAPVPARAREEPGFPIRRWLTEAGPFAPDRPDANRKT